MHTIKGWNTDHRVTAEQAAKLQDQILELMAGEGKYTLPDGTETEGVAFSWCISQLRQRYGWRNLGSVHYDFQNLFTTLGFRMVRGAKNRRGNRAEIVTL
jgi:hypothetical protein